MSSHVREGVGNVGKVSGRERIRTPPGSRGQKKTMLATANFVEEEEALIAVTMTAGRRGTGRSHHGTTPSTVIPAVAARAGGSARWIGNDCGEAMGGGSTQD